MTSENVEISEISSDHKYNSETKLTMEGREKAKSGCFISSSVGVFLFILAALLAIGVGLIVYVAADGKDVVCNCGNVAGTVSTDAIKDKCMDIAKGGDSDVCNKCPSKDVATTKAAPVTATPTAKPKVTDVRLPLNVIPVHYDVRLQPYMYTGYEKDFTFKGECSIIMKCEEATNTIKLHSKTLKIDSSRLEGVSPTSSVPTLLGTDYDEEREFLIFKLSQELEAGRQYRLSMNYTSPLVSGMSGLYLSSYQRNNTPVYLTTSQFEPTDARKAFPCFDEPALKATFNITLVRKKELISLSNTRIIATSNTWSENGVTFVADVYDKTPKMSTYLLAFIICDFEFTSGTTINDTEYRAYSRPEVKNSTQYALDVGLKVLPFYEQYFETKYPLPKQDMIAVPDFAAGAMENWGLITYRETAMLYEEGVSNERNKERVAVVVSHELAHMWFGDLVSPSWWDDLWLNEGFATFVEFMGVDHAEHEWKMFEKFVIDNVQRAFNFDGLVTSHPVYVPVNHPDEINEIFDTISYAKGGSVIRMMRHFLGVETFRKGLVRYLQRKKYGSAFHDDLWAALEEQAKSEGKDIKVKEIMDTWTLQMNYPVIMVTRDFNDANLVHVTQHRYLIDPTAEDPGKYTSDFGYKWTVPITLTSSRNPNFLQNDADINWLYKYEDTNQFNIGEENLASKSDPNGWILANTEQNGFYRVNYQISNWKALINQLDTDHQVIAAINRAQIINDAWNLAKPGELDLTIALNTSNYLNKEMSYIPWTAANRELGYVGDMVSLTSAYGHFKKFMKDKSGPVFAKYGLNNTGASHIETLSRTTIASIACGYGIETCTSKAVEQYKTWMNNPDDNKIDPNLKSTIYCTAIAHGDWEEWEFALKMYKKSIVASEKIKLLMAMACSRKSWILNHYLQLTIQPNSPVRKQDADSVISRIGSSTIGHPLAWQFYREYFDHLRDYFASSFSSWRRLISSLTGSFNTEYQLSELKAFMETRADKLGTAQRAFDQAIEKIRTNIKWMDKSFPIVTKWLSAYSN